MRKVILRMNEQKKYEIIKELVDHNGNKNKAALKLGISKRQVNRLIIIYKEKGKPGFVHGNRSRKPPEFDSEKNKNRIQALYRKGFYCVKHLTFSVVYLCVSWYNVLEVVECIYVKV
jgi:hypothetical protein